MLEEIWNLLISFFNSPWGNKLITIAVFVIIFNALLALIKHGSKKTAEKIAENKPKAMLYMIGFAGILMIIFAGKIAAYLEVPYWTVIEVGLLITLIGFAELIFKGGKKIVSKGIKEL